MNCYYVYLLECRDGSYYVGVTNDLSNRMIAHQIGFNQNCYTYTRRPVLLKYNPVMPSEVEALPAIVS